MNEAARELAIRELEKRHEDERDSLIEFLKFMWKEEKKEDITIPAYYADLEDKLKKMLKGEITRLIINVPPRTGKTLMVTELFPIWAMGRGEARDFIATGYSTNLTREFSGHARDWYNSPSYKKVFPRRAEMREDQNTKEYWKTEENQSYYATGTGGSITGRGCDIFIIDDPIKPDEADKSDVQREGINSWYKNTVRTRLNNPQTGGIIVIMQRTHENDLAGFLMEEEAKGVGEKWEKVIIPAINEDGTSMWPERFPIDLLEDMKRTNPIHFSTQMQQEPTNKDAQEFHEEFWSYHDLLPEGHKRYFAMLDPAFKTGTNNDSSVFTVGCLVNNVVYLEEIVGGKFDPITIEDKAEYIARKYDIEKFGIEAYGAQAVVGDNIRRRFRDKGIICRVEDFSQKGSKEDKIRSIISPLRNRKISFRRDMAGLETLEDQLKKFPRGRHDDYPDALQMLWNLIDMQPSASLTDYQMPQIEYDHQGRPIYK